MAVAGNGSMFMPPYGLDVSAINRVVAKVVAVADGIDMEPNIDTITPIPRENATRRIFSLLNLCLFQL